jgi:excisionase family DNA binding protein
MSDKKTRQQLCGVAEAASFLSVSKWTLRRLVDAGALPVVRLPLTRGSVRRLLFDREDLETLVENAKEKDSVR